MASKVYYIGLRFVAEALKKYIERNRAGLEANLTSEQMTCVLALLEAVIECLTVLPARPLSP